MVDAQCNSHSCLVEYCSSTRISWCLHGRFQHNVLGEPRVVAARVICPPDNDVSLVHNLNRHSGMSITYHRKQWSTVVVQRCRQPMRLSSSWKMMPEWKNLVPKHAKIRANLNLPRFNVWKSQQRAQIAINPENRPKLRDRGRK
jgi:hypothetical protein